MPARQAGVTLMETMIALALSTVVTIAMVVLMGNSMGSATRIIDMTQLSDELRNAMNMMARDVRRANYSANSIYCYGNADCATDGSAAQSIDVQISADNSCFLFQLDRDGDGSATDDDAGGFRLVTEGGTGYIEMWVGDNAPDCDAASTDWFAVTDPDVFDITTFQVVDDDCSQAPNIPAGCSSSRSITGENGTTTARQRQIQLVIEGELQSDPTVRRQINDVIRVRNDFVSYEPNS